MRATVSLRLESARPTDASAISRMHDDATAWLASRGLDQWQRMHSPLAGTPARGGDSDRSLAAGIARGEVLVHRADGGEVVATITVDTYADPEFWTPEEIAQPALYLHRMIVARHAAGQDLGGAMIEWAAQRAANLGYQWLRLDAWRTNTGLHAYYQRHGFTHIRTVELAHRGSGALFQRAVKFG